MDILVNANDMLITQNHYFRIIVYYIPNLMNYLFNYLLNK